LIRGDFRTGGKFGHTHQQAATEAIKTALNLVNHTPDLNGRAGAVDVSSSTRFSLHCGATAPLIHGFADLNFQTDPG